MRLTSASRFGIMKATKLRSGDGWKDRGRKGDVCFVYAHEIPSPYAAGQFPRVGCPIWSASVGEHRFERPTLLEIVRLIPALIADRRNPLSRAALAKANPPEPQP